MWPNREKVQPGSAPLWLAVTLKENTAVAESATDAKAAKGVPQQHALKVRTTLLDSSLTNVIVQKKKKSAALLNTKNSFRAGKLPR